METIIATALVGGVCAGAVRVVAAAKVHAFRHDSLLKGQRLADELLDEALAKPFDDPDATITVFGLDSGEVGPLADRASFDDVDDFHGWYESPPRTRDGATLPGYDADWMRFVLVERVSPGLLVVGPDSGRLRVTVSVRRRGAVVATSTGYRTRAADAVSAEWTDAEAAP
ncbi:MAG: hypothetical protein AAF288_05420 [Planctomycetota bacterium]